MTTTYSPHHDGGGTLHLPSPTHLDRSSSTSTLAQLRRSLSKSPSKHSAFRLLSSKSASHSPKSPLSPQARLGPFSLPVDENSLVSSPLAAAFPPSAKKPRPPLRRLSPMGATFALDNSSAKKPLSESSDHGNGTPNSSDGLPSETGKLSSQNSFAPPYTGSKGALKGTSERHDQFLSPSLARTRKDKAVEFADLSAAKSSPLKRSDGCADLDMVQMGSPAKRRSLHFPSLGSGFDIFDQSPLHQSTQMARSNSDTLSAESPTRSEFANSFSPLPKRASSLRKTTLQQRHDKPTFSKTKPSASLAFEMHTPGTSSLKSRARLSLDHPTAHPNRGSPFAHATSLPSASVHPLQNVSKDGSGDFHHAATKHPLSRTLTTSSTSTFEDDSPTHAPVRHVEIKKTMHDFSKSLPLGATRPASRGTQMVDSSSQDTDFSTPESYKLAKPMPAAFMSTGLISKRQKNIAQEQLDFQGSIGHMPDTPCKRPTSNVAVGPVPTPDVHVEKVQKRNHAHSFGSPSTPLGSSGANPAPAFAKGTSVFGSGFQDGFAARRGSFFGGEGSVSPLGVLHAQRGASVMVPPTPTKHLMACDLSESPEVDMADSATPPRDGSKSPFPDPDSSPILERHSRKTPQTPSENMVPPDPSSLSISGPRVDAVFPPILSRSHSTLQSSSVYVPATPTAPRDSLGRSIPANVSVTPIHHNYQSVGIDSNLTSRFDKVELIGNGEFSQVFRVVQPPPDAPSSLGSGYFAPSPFPKTIGPRASTPALHTSFSQQVYAVKKTRNAFIGPRDRARKLQEVEVLRALGDDSPHTLHMFDSWEADGHLYIQTEYCDEKSLDKFLQNVGRKWRLDDFRIWKILLELALGLKHVHDSGFIHLDLKPANVLITFEGALKIADFGLASPWPAPAGTEGEGDREYIGPEILMGIFDKPADIFALGLILLEIAANVMLPDNGASWQRLRGGDLSDVPRLTSGLDLNAPVRDEMGNPVDDSSSATLVAFYSAPAGFGKLEGPQPLPQPPAFALDPGHEHALDKLVEWMIQPRPEDRPVVDELLDTEGIQWARARRRAGATVYEGNWGPPDEVLANDLEMMMVDAS